MPHTPLEREPPIPSSPARPINSARRFRARLAQLLTVPTAQPSAAGHFVVRHAFGTHENDHIALIGRQSRESSLQILVHELVMLIRNGDQCRGVNAIGILDLSTLLAMRRKEVVAQDGEQPCPQIRPFLEALSLAEGLQNGVLNEVFGAIDALGQGNREAAQVRDTAHNSVDEFLIDRFLMSANDLRDARQQLREIPRDLLQSRVSVESAQLFPEMSLNGKVQIGRSGWRVVSVIFVGNT